MDTVFIKGLTIDTVIGIYDWEKKIRQDITLDIEMDFDIKNAAKSDDIKDTLDYKTIGKRIIAFVKESKFELVETLAEEICKIIVVEFGVAQVKLKLDKGDALRGASGVGVIITRNTKDYV